MRKANHKEAKGKLILRYIGGDISKSESDLAYEVLDNQMMELEKQISQLMASENEASMRKSFDYMKSQLASYGNFDVIDREVLNFFVRKIMVFKNKSIEITYKFSI